MDLWIIVAVYFHWALGKPIPWIVGLFIVMEGSCLMLLALKEYMERRVAKKMAEIVRRRLV